MTIRISSRIRIISLLALITISACVLPEGDVIADPVEPTRFEDVTEAAGIEGGVGQAAWADYDHDGDVDLMNGSALLQNNGDGTFKRVEVGASGPGVWGDANNDGRLDFYRHTGEGELRLNQGGGMFKSVEFFRNTNRLSESAAWADANGDGILDLYVTNYEHPQNPQRDFYIESNADGTYKKAVQLNKKQAWSARGVNWADFDNDGDQDLYVSNYRLMPNQLYVNDGSGKFTEQGWQRGVAGTDSGAGRESPDYIYTGHTIGSCWGDLNNDGLLDLIVVNFAHPPKWQNRPQVLVNDGPPDYKFTDTNKDAAAGIYWQESYAKAALGDYDNDGDLDVYMTTVYGGDTGELFENDGSGRFRKVGDELKVRRKNSYQVAWADYDNDGDLDLFVAGRLFRNIGNRHSWIKVKVVGGAGSNGAAIGARVRVTSHGGKLAQIREVSGGNSGNQNPLTAHFGLRDHNKTVKVEVFFPSGKYNAWHVKPRTTFVARESEAKKPGGDTTTGP